MLKKLDFCLAAMLFIAALLAGNFMLLPSVCGVSHDDAIYVITAKALATGKGYSLISLPGSPLQTKYPILYPAILSLVWKLFPNFPDNLLPMKYLSVCSGALAIGLGYLYLVRWKYASRITALCGALFCTLSTWYWYCATLTQTEAPFSVLLICALWSLEKQIQTEQKNALREFLASIILCLPLLCRVLGVVLIPEAIWLLYKFQRPLKFAVAGIALATVPWICSMFLSWTAIKSNPVLVYYTDYLGWWSQSGLYLANIFFSNLAIILIQSSSLVFSGLHMLALAVFGNIYLVVAAIFGILPWLYLWSMYKARPVLPVFMAGYILLLCICPWPPGRYLVPLLPIFSALLVAQLARLVEKLPPKRLTFAISLVSVSLLIVANFSDLVQKSSLDKQQGYPSIPFERRTTVNWSSYLELFSWLKTHSHQDSVIASEFDTMIYLYTERISVRPCPVRAIKLDSPPDMGTVSELRHNLNQFKVQYLVAMPLPGFNEEQPFYALIEAAIKSDPRLLEKAYVGEDRRFVVYKVL